MSATPHLPTSQSRQTTGSFEAIEAHEQAALKDTHDPYPPPINELLRIGEARGTEQKARIAGVGLTQAHVADLVRLVRDRRLNTWDDEERDELWGPIHALIALEQLDASDYVSELVPLFDLDSDWASETLPSIFGRAGATALEPLRAYVHDDSRWMFGRAAAFNALVKIAEQHPDLRDQVIQALVAELDRAAEHASEINGYLVTALAMDLHAAETLPTIRRAFELDRVDESIMGDWLDVLQTLEQPIDPADPLVARYQQLRRTHPQRRQAIPNLFAGAPNAAVLASKASAARKGSAAKKRKNKRKAASAARRHNKRK